jgi:outer membrane lipoprotein LolB
VIRVFHPFSKVAQRAIFLLSAILLSACSYLPETTLYEPENWPQTLARHQQITSWKILGSIGVQTEENGGSMDLSWKQQNDHFKIRLFSAFGLAATQISGDENSVRLISSDEDIVADNLDDLVASALGAPVPVIGLRDWIRGIPMQNVPVSNQSWTMAGQLYKFVQQGWNIEMKNYRSVNQYILPHEFYLGRDDRPELGIRLIVREWKLSEESSKT